MKPALWMSLCGRFPGLETLNDHKQGFVTPTLPYYTVVDIVKYSSKLSIVLSFIAYS